MLNERKATVYSMNEYLDFTDIFIESFCVIRGLYGVVDFQLWEVQKNILKQVENSDHVVFVKHNLSGFTTLMCGYVLWYLFTHKNDTVYFVTDSSFMVNKIYELIKFMSTNIKKDLRFGSNNITHKNNNTIVKILHKMPMIDGDLLIVDEADNLNKSSELHKAPDLFKRSIMYSKVFWDKQEKTPFRMVLDSGVKDGRFKRGAVLAESFEAD